MNATKTTKQIGSLVLTGAACAAALLGPAANSAGAEGRPITIKQQQMYHANADYLSGIATVSPALGSAKSVRFDVSCLNGFKNTVTVAMVNPGDANWNDVYFGPGVSYAIAESIAPPAASLTLCTVTETLSGSYLASSSTVYNPGPSVVSPSPATPAPNYAYFVNTH